MARDQGIGTVIVHDGDGVTEAIHPVDPKPAAEAAKPPGTKEDEPETFAVVYQHGREMGF